MSDQLDSLAAIAARRRAFGDIVDETPERLVAGTSINGAPSVVEIRWQSATATLHVVEFLALEVPEHALTAVAIHLVQANGSLGIPGFVLREVQGVWRVAFIGYAFLDERKQLSAFALDELVRVVRINAITFLPQFSARVAEASTPLEARLLANYNRRNPKLAGDVVDRLREAIAREAGPFVPRLGNAMLAELEQPFFGRSSLLELVSPSPLPARSLYCAIAPDGTIHVLSRRLDALRALCLLDPPSGLDQADQAFAFMNLVAVLTAHELGELRVSEFDEIPWQRTLSEDDRKRIGVLRSDLGLRIEDPVFEPTAYGHRLAYWCVAASHLKFRQVNLASTGEVEVLTEELASLPVPSGRTWAIVLGRLVPTS